MTKVDFEIDFDGAIEEADVRSGRILADDDEGCLQYILILLA